MNTQEKVLRGKHGYLFLNNDTNLSVDQYTGTLKLSDESISCWEQYFKYVCTIARNKSSSWCFLIVPNKEEVLSKHYPYTRGKVTPIDQFLEAFSDYKEVLYPISELSIDRSLTYYTVDTHWSDYGAYIAAMSVLKIFSLEKYFNYIKCDYSVKNVLGDLGRKLSPQQFGERLTANFNSYKKNKIFENGIYNHGRICVLSNQKSPSDKSLVIFGDSFSMNLIWILNKVFRRVSFAHTVAAMDQDVLKIECPNYILLQSSQRFIIRVPEEAHSIWSYAEKKVKCLQHNENINLNKLISSYSHHSCEYYKFKMLKLIEDCARFENFPDK